MLILDPTILRNELLADQLMDRTDDALGDVGEGDAGLLGRDCAGQNPRADQEKALLPEQPQPVEKLFVGAGVGQRRNLALPDLSPDWLARRLDVSRASLYRLFADRGGIMRNVQERRLLAVRAALGDPLDTRRLARLSSDLGFKSEAHFSRSFRARFGITASAYRKAQLDASAAIQLTSPAVVQQWWTAVTK